MNEKRKAAAEATAQISDDNDSAKLQHFDVSAKFVQEKIEEGMDFSPLQEISDVLERESEEAAQAGEESRSRWKNFIFDFSDRDITQPDWLMTINGVDTFPRGSLNSITGKAGQGKTQWAYLLAAVIARQKETLGIIPRRPATNIVIDTEQEPWSISDKGNRMLRLIGLPDFSPAPDGLTFLSLRQVVNNKERLEIALDAIRDTKPGVVFIDGITDMVEHLEDQDEAQQLVAGLLKTIDEMGITMFLVIHQNEGSESTKMRSFIGSELSRKCFTISEVSVDNGAFRVHTLKSRSIPVPDYRFRINGFGDLTQSMAETPQTEEGRIADLMKRVIETRNGPFDSKQQIYTLIKVLSPERSSDAKAKSLFDKAEALGIVKTAYNGHKYKLTLTAGNSGNVNFAVGGW